MQFQPDEAFYSRFLSEILLHLGQYPSSHPWLAVVIYPSQSVERLSPSTAPFLELPNLRRVYLDQLPLLDSANPKLWLIALIVADLANIAPIIRKVQTHYASQPSDAIDWPDLLETVLVYKLPKFTREEIRNMLNFTDISLKETRFYQDVFGEGREEGHQEGRKEGLVEGEAALLIRLLERKFGALPDTARRRIAGADAETLLAWGERLLDANSLDEVWGH